MGFDIKSISSLEDSTISQDLLPFVATKRPTRAQRRSLRRPPLSTSCIVHLAPPPQEPLRIRSIVGGPQALDDFLAKKPLPLATLTTPVETLPRPTPNTRNSSAQAPTLTKRKVAAPHTTPRGVAGTAGMPLPLHPTLPDAHTTNLSKLYWRRGTQTKIPYQDRTHTRPWYLPHLHGTAWVET